MAAKDQELVSSLPVDQSISTQTTTVTEEDGTVVTTKTILITNSQKIDGVSTLQNIYKKQDSSTAPDESEINLVRRNSKRRSLNKEAYIKLHKNITNRKSIEVLKGKYEPKLQLSETEVVKAKVNGSEAVHKDKETDPNEVILRSTHHIEDLQNRLSSKLSDDTVELLKVKYSPSNFGYSSPELAKKPVSVKPKLPEKPTKIPPKPPIRTSTLNRYKKQQSYEFETKPAHEVVLRSSSEDSIEKLENFMSEFTMEPKREVKEKKRTSSFRKILSVGLFSKDKKKSDKKGGEEKIKSKKTENVVLADNVQNEQTFNKNSTQRYTVDNHYSKQPKKSNSEANTKKDYTDSPTNNLNEMERKYAEMHINQFNKIKASFSNPEQFPNSSSETYQYVHENDNTSSTIDKYIDTSSSSNTLESIDRSTYQNALIAQAELKQMREKELLAKQKGVSVSKQTDNLRNQTPPRAKETYQNVQLVKPKALIPINSERALPNPYHNGQEEISGDHIKKSTERNLDIDEKDYATKIPMYNRQNDFNDVVYEYNSNKMQSQQEQRQYSPNLTKSSTSSSNQNSPSSPSFSPRSSPRSPTLEGTKLRLPSNREKVNLQPRIKSPIPQPKVSTEKIIATELLKNKTESKKNEKPLPLKQQRIHDDYIDGNIYEPKSVNSQIVKQSPVQATVLKPPEIRSAADAFEAAKWHQRQRELADSPTFPDSSQVFADVMVHADPDMKRNSLQYSSLPVTMRKPKQDGVNLRQRPVTPVKRVPSTASLQQSPQKHEIRQSVELYCWKEIQKMKEKQDKELKYQLQYTPYGYVEDPIIQRRSRSVEPVQQRNTKRSTSLPREVKSNVTPRTYYREPIPENRPIVYKENDVYAQKNTNFLRNSPQRRTVSGMTSLKPPQMYEGYYSSTGEVPYRPIFNRGSLSPQIQSDAQAQLQKKVSFNGNRLLAEQPWPTRNGYVQNPPQRRLEKTMSVGDDEVFLRDSQIKQMNEQIQKQMVRDSQYSVRDSISSLPRQVNLEEPNYGTKINQFPVQNTVIYVSKPQEKIINEPLYVTRQNRQNITELSKQKQENLQNIYGTKQQPDIDPLFMRQSYPVRNQQLVLAQDVRDNGSVINEPIYGSKQQLVNERYYTNNIVTESPYGTRRVITTNPVQVSKQVTITNKVCDIYGNIHDNGKKMPVSPTNNGQIQQTGVIYGQLQGNVVVGRPPQYQSYNQIPSNFVRGTRLTASANDMYRRHPNDMRYREVVYEEGPGPYAQHANFNPNAPLPPTPNESSKLQLLMMRRNNSSKTYPHASDTESDTSEVRRIMNRNYPGGNGMEDYRRPSVIVYETKYEYNTQFLTD